MHGLVGFCGQMPKRVGRRVRWAQDSADFRLCFSTPEFCLNFLVADPYFRFFIWVLGQSARHLTFAKSYFMKIFPQLNPGMDKIATLISDIGAGMLTTPNLEGVLASRPMMPLEIDARGSLWFFTRPSGEKEADGAHLNLSFAKPSDATYVSVTGRSTLLYDRARIDELWSALAKPWFPEGKDDPHLALLRVDVDTAEYWDSSASKMVRLWSMATAAVSGKQAELGENAVVTNLPGATVVSKKVS